MDRKAGELFQSIFNCLDVGRGEMELLRGLIWSPHLGCEQRGLHVSMEIFVVGGRWEEKCPQLTWFILSCYLLRSGSSVEFLMSAVQSSASS